ncbi:hypothetical protein IQ249_04230 [Lusitaniella coriacea LEGE 07157]|uniref:Uncharacterized protein n=1 Tax=Lusitaniella coriacea LEGE 07157 TaxID=945747 RepID=A0A8J7DT08_9CYAN|nr:hypothetical protein [Lusitaniella coriacea]MBE9115102.1 hypothetical protein [Lusitaniella coriacea LEGE 07157]
MAKRRNLKKEKAARNLAYARQFRQKTSRSFSGNQRFSNNANKDKDKDKDSNDTTKRQDEQ